MPFTVVPLAGRPMSMVPRAWLPPGRVTEKLVAERSVVMAGPVYRPEGMGACSAPSPRYCVSATVSVAVTLWPGMPPSRLNETVHPISEGPSSMNSDARPKAPVRTRSARRATCDRPRCAVVRRGRTRKVTVPARRSRRGRPSSSSSTSREAGAPSICSAALGGSAPKVRRQPRRNGPTRTAPPTRAGRSVNVVTVASGAFSTRRSPPGPRSMAPPPACST